MDKEKDNRLASGVTGLDTILTGGFVPRGLYIVRGAPGTGKTILANQIAFFRAAKGDSIIFFTLLAEPHDRMIHHLRGMSFADFSLLPERLRFVSAYAALDEEGLPGLLELVRESIRRHQPRLIVIDGLFVATEHVSGGNREFRRMMYNLQLQAAANDCTMLLLTNGPAGEFSPEYTMVDGLIELADERRDVRTIRTLEVTKMRGASQLRGRHVYRITDAGLIVWPRLETVMREQGTRQYAGTDKGTKLAMGVEGLDELLKGGLPARSTTLLVGPSGSGKTTLGLTYLGHSTPDRPGVMFCCYETREELFVKAAGIGIDLAGLVASGAVTLVEHRPLDTSLDEMAYNLLGEVEARRPSRVFIDGIGAFEQAAVFPSRLRNFFTALSLRLRAEAATTLCTTEARDLFLPSDIVLESISPVAENVLMLRLAEYESRLIRLMSVLKVRQSGFDPTIRPFEIDDTGIRLLPVLPRVEQIIRGAPHYALRP